MEGGEHAFSRGVFVFAVRNLTQAQLLFVGREQLQRDVLGMIEEDVVTNDLGGEPELFEPRQHVVGEFLFSGRSRDVRLLGECRQPLARPRGRDGVEENFFRFRLRFNGSRREADRGRGLSDESGGREEESGDEGVAHAEAYTRNTDTTDATDATECRRAMPQASSFVLGSLERLRYTSHLCSAAL